MNHTPGPWQVGFPDGSGRNYITDFDGRVVVRGSQCAATGVIKRADAKLIAAAPEMLSILQAMLAPNADAREVYARIEAVIERVS